VLVCFEHVASGIVNANHRREKQPQEGISFSLHLDDCLQLEREIHAGAHHAEVVLRTIHKIPAEITNPTDVRRNTDFKPTANLTERLGFGS